MQQQQHSIDQPPLNQDAQRIGLLVHHPPNETHHAEREAVYVCAFPMIKNRNGRK